MKDDKPKGNEKNNPAQQAAPAEGQPGGDEVVVKQAVIGAGGLQSGRVLRVGGGFRGHFLGARFDDDGRSIGPVTPQVEEALRAQFPRAEIEAVEE